MKETGLAHWINPNTDATNESGWTGRGGGNRHLDGTFLLINQFGSWWSSSEDGANAHRRVLRHSNGVAHRDIIDKRDGLSVRCLKD